MSKTTLSFEREELVTLHDALMHSLFDTKKRMIELQTCIDELEGAATPPMKRLRDRKRDELIRLNDKQIDRMYLHDKLLKAIYRIDKKEGS